MSSYRIAFLLLITLVVPATATADIITNLIGDVQFTPLGIDIALPADAVNANGVLHVVGEKSSGGFARQTIDLSTGTKSSLFDFVPQNGSSNPASLGVSAAMLLVDGRVAYAGQSRSVAGVTNATVWFSPDSPLSVSTSANNAGSARDISATGLLAGTDTGVASVSTLSQGMSPLPGNVSGGARDISLNDLYIAGDAVWTLGQSGYEQLSTLGFDQAPNSVGLPTTWDAVEIDPVTGDGVLSGAYLDVTTFDTHQGFWRTDGTFLFSEANAVFSDFEIYEGQLVAALNGADDGILYAITDGSRLTMEELRGEKTKFAGKGLYQGSAGFVLEGSGGNIFITSHSTTAVPEPSSIALCLIATAGLALRRRRTRSRRTSA